MPESRLPKRGVLFPLWICWLVTGCSGSAPITPSTPGISAGQPQLPSSTSQPGPAPAATPVGGATSSVTTVAGAASGRPATAAAGANAAAIGGAGGGGRAAAPAQAGAAGRTTTSAPAGTSATVRAGAGSTEAPPALDAPVCKGATSQAVIIGDSFINWASHNLPSDLAAEAGESWRMYAEGGASLTAGGIATLVPDQFEIAIAADPDIKLVVMDGGGNDVLISDAVAYPGSAACKEMGARELDVCKKIVADTLATFAKLQDRAAEIGVRDIVYFFYPDVPSDTPIGGPFPNEIATYARPMWKANCEAAEQRLGGRLRCHFVDMAPVFKDHPRDWFALDGGDIHPNPMGSAAMAKAIWSKMTSDCVWQPAEAGCGCSP